MLEERSSRYYISFRGKKFAEAGEDHYLFDALVANVKGFETILRVLHHGPQTGGEIQDALQIQHPDYKLPWDE